MFSSIKKRLYEDFFKKSRLPEYKKLLETAKASGYRMMGILDFYELIKDNRILGEETKILLVRHDIDTSPKITKKLFEIEKSVFGHEGSSTFYFRDYTTSKKVISQIEEFGYETGFHYETIANYEKRKHFKNATKLREHFDDIKMLFEKELQDYRKKTNTESKTVSSHGDWVNVRLGITNRELLNDCSLRNKNHIILEAYDEEINKYVKKRFADQKLVEKFVSTVSNNLDENVVMLLIHPRQWKVDFWWNVKDNLKRMFEGILYKF